MTFWTSCLGASFSLIHKIHFNIFSREKYRETRVNFRSVADLRLSVSTLQMKRKVLPQTPNILSTLQLIKSYIESTKSDHKKQVRHFLKIFK